MDSYSATIDTPTPSPLKYSGGFEIQGLQIAKFFCAFLVVLIHTDCLMKDGLLAICRTAVPLFFTITGYFMPDKHGIIREARITSMLRKIFIIFLLANGLYFAQQLFHWMREGTNPWNSISYLVESVIFLTPTIPPLWYLGALLQALLVLWLAVRSNKLRWCYAMGGIGLIIGIMLGT